MRHLAIAALLALLPLAARADPPTTVLVTQTVDTLSAATDKALTGTGPGIRMLCLQNIGANAATLAFDTAAVAGSGWALAASGAANSSICWGGDTVPRSVVHAISTSGTSMVVLVGR